MQFKVTCHSTFNRMKTATFVPCKTLAEGEATLQPGSRMTVEMPTPEAVDQFESGVDYVMSLVAVPKVEPVDTK